MSEAVIREMHAAKSLGMAWRSDDVHLCLTEVENMPPRVISVDPGCRQPPLMIVLWRIGALVRIWLRNSVKPSIDFIETVDLFDFHRE